MARCKICKGTGLLVKNHLDKGGLITNDACQHCEGTGIVLHSIIEEQFDEAGEISGDKIYPDQPGFIGFEEEDYEV